MEQASIALVGILGITLGILVSEILRRKNRREQFAPEIFSKRLTAYEGLFEKIYLGNDIANEIIKSDKLNQTERHHLTSHLIGDIAEHADANMLYLDPDICAHSTALFMGIEDIYSLEGSEKKEMLHHYYDMRKEALRMIKEDSGVAEINVLFTSINKPKLSGPIIERLRELRRSTAKH